MSIIDLVSKLTSDDSKYKLWCCIFKYICSGAKVLGHITRKSKPTGEYDEDWASIDSHGHLLTLMSNHGFTPLLTCPSYKSSPLIHALPKTCGIIYMSMFSITICLRCFNFKNSFAT